jgi:hypothetical protein
VAKTLVNGRKATLLALEHGDIGVIEFGWLGSDFENSFDGRILHLIEEVFVGERYLLRGIVWRLPRFIKFLVWRGVMG